MNEINIIYNNEVGIAFKWENGPTKKEKKVQLVFKDTGLLLNRKELYQFSKNISADLKNCTLCRDCKQKESHRSIILETPLPQLSFAVSHTELTAIGDLLDGTLFQLQLENSLDEIL